MLSVVILADGFARLDPYIWIFSFVITRWIVCHDDVRLHIYVPWLCLVLLISDGFGSLKMFVLFISTLWRTSQNNNQHLSQQIQKPKVNSNQACTIFQVRFVCWERYKWRKSQSSFPHYMHIQRRSELYRRSPARKACLISSRHKHDCLVACLLPILCPFSNCEIGDQRKKCMVADIHLQETCTCRWISC